MNCWLTMDVWTAGVIGRVELAPAELFSAASDAREVKMPDSGSTNISDDAVMTTRPSGVVKVASPRTVAGKHVLDAHSVKLKTSKEQKRARHSTYHNVITQNAPVDSLVYMRTP